MPRFPLAAALASAAARRHRNGRTHVTAIGATWKAVLSTSERGPILSRSARSRSLAFTIARTLLDQAEDQQFNRGEIVSVEVRQADE